MQPQPTAKKRLLMFLLGIVVSFCLAKFINIFLLAAYIKSGGMAPTLQRGDRVVINKSIYHFQKPKREDIILFLPPKSLQETFSETNLDPFAGRVIGLPGENIEVKDNSGVYVNAQLLSEKYIDSKPRYSFGPVTVPSNQYIVLGDNRNNSYDSHNWGFVPRKNIIGKISLVYWPLNRIGNKSRLYPNGN